MAEPGTWATRRLDALVAGAVDPLPPVVETLRLGTLNEWRPGWAKKLWQPSPEIMSVDGSLFGGYIAALADQILSFAALSVVPADKIFRTTHLAVNFIRVGKAETLTIEGRVVAQTKQLITVRATFQRGDGELIAEASAQQLLQPL